MNVDSKFFRLLPGCEHSGFSINREGQVACLRSDRGERALVVVSDSSSIPRVVAHERSLNLLESSNAPLLPPVWDPAGTSLAFGRDGIWILSAEGQGIRKVSGRKIWMPSAGRRGASGDTNLYQEKNAYLAWLPDGKSVIFVERSDPNHVALWQAAVDGSYERKLLGQVRTIQSFAIAPSGRQVAVVSTDGLVSDLFLIDLQPAQAAHQKIDLGEHRSKAIYRYPKVIWSPQEDWLVFRGAGSGWSKHYRAVLSEPEGAKFEPLTAGAWEDGEMVLSPDGSQAILSSRERSPFDERLFRLDLQTLERHPLGAGEEGFFMPVAWVDNGFYYTFASIHARGDLYHYDLDSGAVHRLTWSDEAAAEQDVEAVSINITMGDSEPALPALLYRPSNPPPDNPLPGVVWCHGGPVSDVSRGWSRQEVWLASQGFAVLVPAFRGSATLGISHMEAGLGEGVGKADLADILAGARWLASQPGIDGDRLAAGGRSWGGYLTLRAVTQAEHPFVCGWAGAAIADWEIQQAETEVRYYDYQLLGGFLTDDAVRARARDRSPVHDITHLKVPLLITHGRKDHDVPFRQIEEFVQALRATGAPLEEHLFFDEGHANKEAANIVTEYSRILAFFRRHLLPWNLTSNPCSGQAVY
jgi:dipeptidyl aminopeptidase/acylaminoacyl peptidase